MTKNFIILTKSEDGKVNGATINKFYDGLKPGKYELSAKRLNRRSLPQNSFIHAVLFPEFRKALNEVGYDEVKTDQQAKEICKKMFLTTQIANKNTGEVMEYTKHTSELTKEEMGIFIDEVIRFAATEMNYQIPYPGEKLMLWQ